MKKNYKVLFIDDDNFFLEFYKVELWQSNLETETAHDGDEGIKKAIEMKPDVILLDVVLPKKDGFEVLKELKIHEETKDIPVIIVSSLASEKDINKLIKLGAVRAFNKLVHLPKDVVSYISESFEKGGFEPEDSEKKKKYEKEYIVNLSKEKLKDIFEESLKDVEKSIQTLFGKTIRLEDINISLIPFSLFEKHILEIGKKAGNIFVYGDLEGDLEGIAIISMKKNDTISIIKLMESKINGKNIKLNISDDVIEEMYNIVVNSFLNKFSKSIKGRYVLRPATILGTKDIKKIIKNTGYLSNKSLVMFMEQAYIFEDLDISFSLFILFDSSFLNK